MASVLEFLLKGDISSEIILRWMQRNSDENENIPEVLVDLENLKKEFIPFFLNYLRDHTIHLLQSSKSATPSPAKTPSLKKIRKSVRKKKDESGKRQQLFGASPAGDVDDMKSLPTSVFSPNTSLDSPSQLNYRNDKPNSRGGSKSGYSSQKGSPQCGSQRSPYSQYTPDKQRSKQKFSLGEFLVTPESDGNVNGWRKKSPHSANRREFTVDNSPSPVISHGRKSGGGRRKHASSPLIQTFSYQGQDHYSPPVFSLTSQSDFPPVERQSDSQERKGQQNHRSLDLKQNSYEDCDKKTSRVINFSNPDQNSVNQLTREKLQEVKRISPVTVCSSTTGVKRLNTKLLTEDTSSSTRRITPTLVKVDNSVPQNSAFLVPIEETVNCKKAEQADLVECDRLAELKEKNVSKDGCDSLAEERELLKKERLKRQTTTDEGNSSVCSVTPRKPSLDHSTSVIEIAEASLSEVTKQDKLDLLVELYSKFLQSNLLPNLIVELYFLVQLLTARGGKEEDTFIYGGDLIEENYFSSVHNTVYFAVSVLEHQKGMLSIIDRGTLRLLLENPRISTFSASLMKYLEDIYEKAESQTGPAYPKSPIGSVSFQADTDNRKNFPSDKSFHTFKRQRDGFYELIREWEASRMNPNYDMGEIFGSRVKALVNMMTDLANLVHFSRLFQSQLIAMCKGDGSISTTDDDDEQIALLSQLKRTNPAKFKRLQERFIKPLSTGGPCPPATFPGIQEFFRDFIVVACNPQLNQHLSDTFAAKVSELDETTFASHDEEDVSSNGDSEDKELFASVLLSMRVVGKFLGFLTFLPYQSLDRVPDTMESMYISIRNKHQLPLDLLQYLCTAMERGTLTLTVPWVVEFLSMMDAMAPKLGHFQLVLYLLLYIHRFIWCQIEEEMFYGGVLLVSIVSWLFENPVIPDGFFFSEIPDEVVMKVKGHMPSLAALDNRNFVDQSMLYTCCPYLGDLRSLLVEFAVGTNSKMSAIRKITPVSADLPKPKSINERQLQLQMEENFFHNHPASMKRVVDFVADRTASNYIKKFRACLLPQSLTDGKDRAIKQVVTVAEGSPTSKLKDKLSMVTKRVSQELYMETRAKVNKDAIRYCEKRTLSLMKLLLPDDQSATVNTMASSISVRIAMEKITQWMNKHITAAMYRTEILPDIDKIGTLVNKAGTIQEVPEQEDVKPVTQSTDTDHVTSHVTADCHDETLPHPSEVLIKLKDYVTFVALKKKLVTEREIQQILVEIWHTCDRRQDILPSVHRAFAQLTVELLVSLLVHSPTSYTSEIITTCLDLWSDILKDSSVGFIFSGRIVLMLAGTADPKLAWDQYTKLLIQMVHRSLIKPLQMQETGLKFLPYILSDKVLTMLCQCLCSVAEAVPKDDRAEGLGTCLEMLYNRLPQEDCLGAVRILEVLEVTTNNNVARQGCS